MIPSPSTFPAFSPALPHDDHELIVTLFGAFEGAFAPSSRTEALIAAHVKRAHLGEIACVYQSRWWDYRRLALGHSFMLFTREFYDARRRAARAGLAKLGPLRWNGKVADEQTQRRFRGLHGALQHEQNERNIWERDRPFIATMWKAMIAADLFGVPYDQFCRLAFRTAADLKWERMPQPRHLYSDRLAALTIDAWEEQLKGRAVLAKHPMYLAANYCGLAVQDAYREWLVQLVAKRTDDIAIPLSIVVYDTPQLPAEIAEHHFGAHTLRRARAMAA